MKKFSFIIVLIIVISMIPCTVFAGTNLSSSHTKAVTKLTDACGYYGWCISEAKTSNKTTKTTSFEGTVLYSGETYMANFKVKTVKTKKNKKTKYSSTYYVGGKKYSLSSIKSMLKDYSSTVGKASSVKKSTIDISDELIAFAKKYDWSVQVINHTQGTDKYAQTIQFENDDYVWKAKVTTTRNSEKKKLIVSYTRDGKKSNRASIEDWLKTYAV